MPEYKVGDEVTLRGWISGPVTGDGDCSVDLEIGEAFKRSAWIKPQAFLTHTPAAPKIKVGDQVQFKNSCMRMPSEQLIVAALDGEHVWLKDAENPDWHSTTVLGMIEPRADAAPVNAPESPSFSVGDPVRWNGNLYKVLDISTARTHCVTIENDRKQRSYLTSFDDLEHA